MKKTYTLLVIGISLVCGSFILYSPVIPLRIEISDLNNEFILNVNDNSYSQHFSLKDFEEALGPPDRVIKQRKGKRRCSGLGGMCGTKISVPKRTFIFYDQLGIELIGTSSNNLFAIHLNFESPQTNSSMLHKFSGELKINGEKFNYTDNFKALLSAYTNYESDSLETMNRDAVDSLKLYNTLFTLRRPLFLYDEFLYENQQQNSRIHLEFNESHQISNLTYFYND